MSLELRVQHLEELVVELREQVRVLQNRLEEATSLAGFDIVHQPPSSPPPQVARASSSAPNPSPQTPTSSTPCLTAWYTGPAPSTPERSGSSVSAAERAAACREIGLFLRRSLDGVMALGAGSLGSYTSSPPQLGAHGTPTSFAPPPGRDGPLLSADMLQRMQALEQRAPLLCTSMPERPQSRTNSSCLPQEAIQAEVARQLVGFHQRAQAQDLKMQRMRRQLEEAT